MAQNNPEKNSKGEEQGTENVRKDSDNRGNERNTDQEANRDPAQSHDYKGEAQNVNDDTGRPSDENELRRSRNKANEGKGPEVIL